MIETTKAADAVLAAHARAVAVGVPGDWYGVEGARVRRMAQDAGAEPTRALVAVAILSPRVKWGRALDLLGMGLRGERMPHLRNLADRAWGALWSELDPRAWLPASPKVPAFFRALSGDPDEPVIDVWAARVAGWDPDRLTPKRYAAARRAYVEAARVLGIGAAEVQARTWVWARGSGS